MLCRSCHYPTLCVRSSSLAVVLVIVLFQPIRDLGQHVVVELDYCTAIPLEHVK